MLPNHFCYPDTTTDVSYCVHYGVAVLLSAWLQMDLMSVMQGVVERQDKLTAQVTQLSSQLERLSKRDDLLAWL